jgi:uncharacterized protein YerC
MAFEKAFENKYSELDAQTKYRFAEIEIGKALKTLTRLHRTQFTPRQSALTLLINLLVPSDKRNTDYEQRFVDAITSTYTVEPPKNERIHYLMMKGHTYTKIRELTKASFNTIASKKIAFPYYYPVFSQWNEEMLQNWNGIKDTLNIWDDELTHTKE